MTFYSAMNVKSIIDFIHDIASRIFPPTIPITMEISIFFFSFLDVCFFPNFATGSLNTYLRLNFDAPGKVPHYSSNSPVRYLIAPCLSNVIRAFRIVSNAVFFETTKELFIQEYVFIGYSSSAIHLLRSRIGDIVKKHSPQELVFRESSSDYGLPESPVDLDPYSLFTINPPSAVFCKVTDSHNYCLSVWATCRQFLPFQGGSTSVALKLKREIKTAITNKALYYRKLQQFYDDFASTD